MQIGTTNAELWYASLCPYSPDIDKPFHCGNLRRNAGIKEKKNLGLKLQFEIQNNLKKKDLT